MGGHTTKNEIDKMNTDFFIVKIISAATGKETYQRYSKADVDMVVRDTARIPPHVRISDPALHQMFAEVLAQTGGEKEREVLLNFKCVRASDGSLHRFHPTDDDEIISLKELYPNDERATNNAFLSRWVRVTPDWPETDSDSEEDPQQMD